MALNLTDVKKKKSIPIIQTQEILHIEKTEKNHSFKNMALLKPQAKEKVLKPWEHYDEVGNQTRTIVAQEAVRRAREIVRKNNLFAKKLRDKFQKIEEEHKEASTNGSQSSSKEEQFYEIKKPFFDIVRNLFN